MTDPSQPGARSIYKEMIRGSSWAIVARWSIRGIGFVSTVILARLLTPLDFGVYAMASIVAGFLRLLTEFGPDSFIIRSREATPALCNTAWTLQVIQGVVVGAALSLMAPLAVLYFHESRLTAVFHVTAVTAAIAGLQNIGMTLVRKELDFARDFRFLVYDRLFKFVTIVPLAFVLRSYWAPVIGGLISTVMTVLLSYGMHGYRPRFGLHRAREILVFGGSMLLDNIGRFFSDKADVVLVGHVTTTAGMGKYNVAAELGKMATAEIVTPMGRGLFPAYARVAHDRNLLRRAYLKSIEAIALLCIPLGVGISVVAPEAVRIILGEKWLTAIPFLRWLAIYALLNSLIDTIIGRVLVVVEREWLSSVLRWVRVAALVPSIVVAAFVWGVDAVPIAATLSAFVALPIIMRVVCGALELRVLQMLACLWRPVVAAIAMAVVVLLLHPLIGNLFVRAFCEVLAGAATYAACVLVCWWASGKPAGIEAQVYGMLVRKLRLAG